MYTAGHGLSSEGSNEVPNRSVSLNLCEPRVWGNGGFVSWVCMEVSLYHVTAAMASLCLYLGVSRGVLLCVKKESIISSNISFILALRSPRITLLAPLDAYAWTGTSTFRGYKSRSYHGALK